MYASEFCGFSFWWVLPILMIALCFFMMKGRRGSMMCGFGSGNTDSQQISPLDSAPDILDKRYALGEINQEEYQEKKEILKRRYDNI